MRAVPKRYGVGGIWRTKIGMAGGGQQADQGSGKAAASMHHPERGTDSG